MPAPRSALLVWMALAGASGAAAQVTTREPTTVRPKDATLFERLPIASVSFAPIQKTGMLEGKQVLTRIERVSLLPANNDILLEWSAKPAITVYAHELPDGIYSVQFAFSMVSVPATVVVKHLSTVLASCALPAQTQQSSTSMRCEASGIEVSGGRLQATLEFAEGSSALAAFLAQITVNRYR